MKKNTCADFITRVFFGSRLPEEEFSVEANRACKYEQVLLRPEDWVTYSATYTDYLKENQLNYMLRDKVGMSAKEEIVSTTINEKVVKLKYNKNEFSPVLEPTIPDNPGLSNVWGDEIYRLSLNAVKKQKQGFIQLNSKIEK